MAFLRLQKLMNNGVQTGVIATWESMVAMNLEVSFSIERIARLLLVPPMSPARIIWGWSDMGEGYYSRGLRACATIRPAQLSV